MKKLFALMLAALAVFPLCAKDEDDVKAVLSQVNRLACELKLSETLPYYAPEYVGVSARGKKVTYDDAVRISKAIDVMFDEKSPILDIYRALMEMQGKTLDADMAVKVQELEQNEEFKQMFRNQMRAAKTMMQVKLRQQVDSFKILDLKVSGDKATVTCRENEADTGKMTERECKLVKTNGKWRIVSDTSKYFVQK